MARPGLKYDEFVGVIETYVAEGTPASKVTLKMLSDKLSASNSTLIKFKNQYVEAHPETRPVARDLPIDIVASIEAYGDARETAARTELGDQVLQLKSSEQALLNETRELSDLSDELRGKVEELSTRNATLEGQTAQQTTEIASLKSELAAAHEKASELERELHAAQAEAQAANGRVDEIRLSTDKQLERLQGDVDQARAAQVAAEQRAVSAEKQAVAAEAHLEGERDAKGTLKVGSDRMSDTLKRLEADLQAAGKRVENEATRAAAAEATVAGLRDQLAQSNATQELLRGMLERHGDQPSDATGSGGSKVGKSAK